MPADILSRCPVDAVETDVTLIKEAQQDEFYQDLKAAFQGKQDFDQVKKPTIAKLLPNISEEKGLFYLQDDTRCVLILSQSLVPGVVQQTHGTLLTGHGSPEKTLYCLRTQYYCSYMIQDVLEAIQQCDRCQWSTQKGGVSGCLHPLPLCTGTNQQISWDLFGPLKTIQSKAHVLCITDAHTKFKELEVVGNK